MDFYICDIGGSGIRVKKFKKVGKSVLQYLDETVHEIEFHNYIDSFDTKNIYLKNNRKLLQIIKDFKHYYVGATAGVRSIVKPKKYNVLCKDKFLFTLDVITSKQEALYEFTASKHKFKNLDSMVSMGSRSCQLFNDNKAYSVSLGFKTPNKNSIKFKILKDKKILGISSLYWAAKKIENKINRKLADNTRGVKINSKFIDLLKSVDLSDYNETDKNQILLMIKIMKHIAGEKTIIIFKREWLNKTGKYVINWATGKALSI